MFWFLRKKVSQAVQKMCPPKPPLNNEQVAEALSIVNNKIYWGLDYRLNKPWSIIPPVKITTKFGGWGYVEGRTKALIVNGRVAICEADDDMDFTEHCVLIDGVPSLLIMYRGGGTTVTIVAERDFLAEVFNTAAMPMNTVEEFRRLPEPVQRVMNDVLEKIMTLYKKIQRDKEENGPIEKMLNY